MIWTNRIVLSILLLACAALDAGALAPIQAVVLEGDSVPGVGSVTLINNLAVNNLGAWFVEADTDFANTDADSVLLRDGAVFLREGFGGLSGPPGAVIDSFDSVTLNNNGDGGFNFFLDPFSSTEDSGIYFNTDLVIQEGTVSTAPGFTPGTPYIGFFDVKVNDAGTLMSVASIDDPAISSSVDRAIVLIEPNPLAESIVAKEGDILAGQTEAVNDFGTGPHQSAFNSNGAVLYFADLTGDSTTDGAIYLDAALVAQEGSASPVAGRLFESLSGRGLDLNNGGDTVFKANLDGDSATDELIVKNGAVFIQEGDAVPGLPAFSLANFGTNSGPVPIDDAGNVLWFGDWQSHAGLFLNDQLLVQEGVSMFDGVLVESISSGADAFVISDNGQWIIFEATLAGGVNGAFLIQVPEPHSMLLIAIAGFALAQERSKRRRMPNSRPADC